MSLFLIGDPHGRIDEYLKLLASLPPGSRSVALGDMYLGRSGVHLRELLGGDGNISGVRTLISIRRNSMRRAGHKSLLVFCALPINWFEVRVTRRICPEVRVDPIR
jgi:hypothetical protein